MEGAIPFSVRRHPEFNALYVRYARTITREDLRILFSALYPDHQVGLHSRSLVDLSDIDSVDVGFKELHWLSHRVQEVRSPRSALRIGIHAPGAVAYGIARIYQQVTESEGEIEVMVHEERAAVLKWLDLPDLALLNPGPPEEPGEVPRLAR